MAITYYAVTAEGSIEAGPESDCYRLPNTHAKTRTIATDDGKPPFVRTNDLAAADKLARELEELADAVRKAALGDCYGRGMLEDHTDRAGCLGINARALLNMLTCPPEEYTDYYAH